MKNKNIRTTKLRIKKGDTVEVIAGNAKGKKGKVLRTIIAKQRIIVEGVNIVQKHLKPSAASPEGKIDKVEASIHISNLMLIEPSTGNPTRVGRKLVDGKLERFSKKTGNFIKNA